MSKIFVIQSIGGEVLSARTNVQTAKDLVKSRVGKEIKWEYHDSHGPIWIDRANNYIVVETELSE